MKREHTKVICETDRLRLRTIVKKDFENVYSLASDQEVMQFVAGTKSESETLAWVDWILENYDKQGICFWAVELKNTGQFIGMVGLLAKEIGAIDEIEISYKIKKEFWGKGYATEAAAACEKIAFSELGLNRLVALIHPENRASKAVIKKLGMSFEKQVEYQGENCEVYVKTA